MKIAGALGSLDVSRLGVLLAGFCYRSTPRLDVGFINSVLKDLAAHDLTDLQAENDFRRAVGLSELAEDRRPLSITHPTPMPAPSLTSDGPAALGGQDPFSRDLGNLEDHSDLILACVFRRFDLAVPPGESDAVRHPGLTAIRKALQSVLDRGADGSPSRKAAAQASGHVSRDPGLYYIEDAARYLGADQLSVDPRKFMYRLVDKGSLPKKKINGRLVFYKADLDRVIANGDQKRGRGRPRRPHSA